MWVVDTCVILDILDGHPAFARPSALALDGRRKDGLIVAPITYVELAPAFNGDSESQDAFLSNLGITVTLGSRREFVLNAYHAWNDHIQRKRAGELKKRPIADVMIGAHALTVGGLITRNEDDFRSLYPALNIFNPAKVDI